MTLYAEPDESSDMLFHYYSGTVAEALEVRFVETSWKSGDTDMACLVASGMAALMDDVFERLNESCMGQLREITIATLDQRIFGSGKKNIAAI